MSFLKNTWYVAALSAELPTVTPLARTICDEQIVLYRDADNGISALADRCCHRKVPLSKGTVEGCNLRCGYHGMVFGPDGACVEIPGQSSIPPDARVKAYVVAERYHWVWIWIGDSSLADPARIPDYHWFDDPDWRGKSTYFHVKADYRYIVDNLLNLSHVSFVHASTIGNRAVVDNAIVTVDRTDHEVRVSRWMHDVLPPPSYVKAAPHACFGRVDRWQIIHFMPPAFVRLNIGASPVGLSGPEAPSATKMEWLNLNAVTPETETTTHYFWGEVHNHDLDKPEVTERIFNEVRTAFLEDVDIFEAQQRSVEQDKDDLPLFHTASDAGSLHALRIIDRLAAEQQEGPVTSLRPIVLRYAPV